MISIVMPTYNQAKFLRESVDSVLAQTHDDFELIIVDDASTDETPEILLSYSDSRIKLVRHERNRGTGEALNTGFKIAWGDIETWVSSDNVMFPNCIETLLIHLEAHPEIDFVYGNCEIHVMDDTGLQCMQNKNILEEVKSQEWSFDKLVMHYFLGIFWLWRGEIRTRAGSWYQPEPCEDYDMALRMAHVGGQFAYVPECVGWFRRHREGISYKLLRGRKPVLSLYDAMKEKESASAVV